MSAVDLSRFDNTGYCPGRSRLTQAAGFFLGLPVLRSTLLPSSRLRVSLLRLFGARVGTGVVIKPGVRVKYPWLLTVGNHCWIGEDCWIDNLARVEMGEHVCLSQGVYLCTGNHDWTDVAFRLIVGPIRLANGCWVGARATVAPGVAIEEHAIAAAGSVVTKDIPAWSVFAGNPARFVRLRNITHDSTRSIAAAPAPKKSPGGQEFAL